MTMTKRYTPKPGDVVTVKDDPTGARWLVLAPAPRETGERCECVQPPWARIVYGKNGSTSERHDAGCPAQRAGGSYWLQHTVTGGLYRPDGADEAVHRSALALARQWTKPTRRITEHFEWSFA